MKAGNVILQLLLRGQALKEQTDQVRLLIAEVLPAGSAVKETLAGRRKRLRKAVARLISPAGWRMVKVNVFKKAKVGK